MFGRLPAQLPQHERRNPTNEVFRVAECGLVLLDKS